MITRSPRPVVLIVFNYPITPIYKIDFIDITSASGIPAPAPSGRGFSLLNSIAYLVRYRARWTRLCKELRVLDNERGKRCSFRERPKWPPESNSIYFLGDLGADAPEIDGVSIATRKKERVASLKGIARVGTPESDAPWNRVAPDGSLLNMRDVSRRELYSLELQLA